MFKVYLGAAIMAFATPVVADEDAEYYAAISAMNEETCKEYIERTADEMEQGVTDRLDAVKLIISQTAPDVPFDELYRLYALTCFSNPDATMAEMMTLARQIHSAG